jgi:hypothetical protein
MKWKINKILSEQLLVYLPGPSRRKKYEKPAKEIV